MSWPSDFVLRGQAQYSHMLLSLFGDNIAKYFHHWEAELFQVQVFVTFWERQKTKIVKLQNDLSPISGYLCDKIKIQVQLSDLDYKQN